MKYRDDLKNTILHFGGFASLPVLAFFATLISPSVGFAASNQSIVYQGRIQRPDGSVPNSGSITFTLSVYSPAPKKCLLYSENQAVNMTGSGGMFSLALGAGFRMDGGAHSFDKIFVNGGTLSGLTCADGSTSYTPGSTDDRTVQSSFNDNGAIVNLSAMEVKSIPFALQAHQIGGYGINDIIKVHPTTGSATTFTTAEMARVRALGGASCASNEILKWNGTTWACAPDLTGGSPGDASYAAKGVLQFDTDAATSGITVASGVAKLSNTGVSANTYGSATAVATIAIDAQGRITSASSTTIALPVSQLTQSSANTGEVLKWNGTAWAPAADATGTSPGDASYAAKGLVQGLTDAATSGLNISSGVISVNAGTGANQIVKLNGSAQLPAVDGSLLTNLSAGNIASGVLPIARGGTNNGSLGVTAGGILYMDGSKAMTTAAGTSGQALISAGAGAPAFGTLGVGGGGTGQASFAPNSLIMANGTGTQLTGMTCSPGQILKWNAGGTAWDCTTDATGTSPGDASYAAKGIVQFDTDAATSGVSVTTGVAKVNTGTGANQIVKLNGSSQLPAVDGSLLTNLSASNLSGAVPINKGGTGQTAKTASFDALSPLTTKGDVIVHDGTSSIRLPAGSNNYVLTADSTQTSGLKWAALPAQGDAGYTAANKGIVAFDTDASTSGVSVTTGVAKINTGTAAHQIVKLDSSARLPAVDGSQLTNLPINSFSGTLPVASGGTGQSAYTTGDMIFATSASAFVKLGIGAAGTILTSTGTAPQWSTVGSLGFFTNGGNSFGAAATFGTNDTFALKLETDGTPKMTIEADGDVGIGTESPATRLHVHKAATTGYTDIIVTNTTTGTTSADGFALGVQNNNSEGYVWNSENAGIYFGTNDTERMKINATGEVGIGTTATAGTKLEIRGNGTSNPVMKLVRELGHPNQVLEFHPGDSTTTHHYITARAPESLKKKLVFSSLHNSNGTAFGNLGFVFRLGPESAPVDVFSILESGYAGIGNITPTSILDIDGAFTQRGMAAPSVSPAGQGRLYFDSTSNKFRISQNGGAYVDLLGSTSGVTSVTAGTGLLVGTTAGGSITSTGTLNINVGTGANQIVQIDGTGKLPAVDGSGLTNLSAANITAGVLPIARGGTNNGSLGLTDGGIVYADGTSLQTTAAGTIGQAFVSQGTGIPAWGTLGVVGGGTGATTLTSNGVLLGNGTSAIAATSAGSAHEVLRLPSGGGAPSFGAIALNQSAAVTGTLPIGNGGTGASSLAANRLIGTNGTGTSQQAVTCSLNQILSFDSSGNYGCYNVSQLTEKSVTFTPTTVGWYRIINGTNAFNLGGVIRIAAEQYDNRITDVEFQFNIGGFSTGGAIQQTRFASYNYGVVDRARISSDGAGSVYLDIYISSATAPGPVTVYADGPRVGTLVAAPVVGAVAGSTDLKVLSLGHGFRTTDGVQVGNDTSACDSEAAGTFRYTTDNAMEFCNGSGWKIVFVNGGSTYTGAATLGTNSNHNLEFETNGSTRVTIDPTGKVGVGVAGPTAQLEVQGQIVSKENIVASGAVADFSTGNTQILQSVSGSTITLNNMVNGGQYTVIVEDTTARTYSFGNCPTTRAVPALATTTGRSVFTILKVSTACYITWITGF